MIAAGILHPQSWHWNVLAWLTGFLIVLIGAVGALLVTVALRSGRGSPLQRSFFAFGPAAFAPAIFFVFLRLVQLVEPAFGPGPQHWLIGWLPGHANDFVHPYDTLVAVHLFSAGVTAVFAVLVALLFPPNPSRRWTPALPGRTVAAVLLGGCALLVPFLAWRVYTVDADTARLLEWVGLLPVFMVAVALRAQAVLPPPPPPVVRVEADAPPAPVPDFRKAWVSAGLLKDDAKPLRRIAARETGDAAGERAQRAWVAIDAPGSAPGSLDTLLDRLPTSRDLFVLGDVPAEAEHALLTALFADLVGSGGLRVLVVHPRPQSLVDGLSAALVRARTWDSGAFVCGADALQEAIAGHQLPAFTAVTVDDFASRLIRMVALEGRGWARGLDLVVVHRPDLGTPIEVTHTAFAFRRWHLAVRTWVRPPALVTVPDTPAHRAFAERLFPGRDVHRVRYEPRTVGESVAWPGHEPHPDAAVPWLARAAEVVTALGHEVGAIDPSGRWSRDVVPRGATLRREPSWQHHASVADFAPGDLVEAAGSIGNRLPAPSTHVSLWALPHDPVARFLHPGRLDALTREGRLPRPAPVVGTRNRFLRLAHLDVALREAATDELSLRAAFGDDLVDFRLRTTSDPASRSTSHSAWREHGEIVRSPHLRGSATSARPRTHTVTSDTVEVVEDRTGEVLAEVDARTASTRFYPKRVFSVGDRQFVVPMHAFDSGRRKLRVELASERDRVTRPVMSFELEVRRVTVERVTRRHGTFQMHTTSAECLVTERVHAAWVPGRDQEERFDVVESAFDSEVRFVFPEKATKGLGLFHLAAVVEALLPVFLRCSPHDAAVIPVRAGFVPGMGAGIAVVDRFIGGMGFASALDDTSVHELLVWSRAMLFECGCMDGCEKCTPPQVLRVGAAKQEVLAFLDGL
ncbi:MAG: hypothetical protein H6736_02190 [Alphaproteobacteria bacterium]|nr:hypothetical protein [Alphaproteobacteria bacterium]MCB9690600.1 hypothetical protein [Alphaproteobacteria bacterium]